MIQKPGEICKFKNGCPYSGFGVKECFGLKKDRDNYFRCVLVDEAGEFKQDIKTTNET